MSIVQLMVIHTHLPIDIAKVINTYLSHWIYRIGGCGKGAGALSQAFRMNVNANDKIDQGKWISLPSMITTRRNATATIINNRYIFVAGGFNNYGVNEDEILSTVECFNLLTLSWRMVSSFGLARWGHCAVAVPSGSGIIGGEDNTKQLLYVMGGVSLGGHLDLCQVYDPSTDQWSSLPPLKQRRSSAVAVAVNNEIYIFGGATHILLSSCERYDTKISSSPSSWYSIKDMPCPRAFAQAVVFNENMIVVMGGCGLLYTMDTVVLYDIDRNNWKMDSISWKLPTMLNTGDNGFSAHLIPTTQELLITSGMNPIGCWTRSISNDNASWNKLSSIPPVCRAIASC